MGCGRLESSYDRLDLSERFAGDDFYMRTSREFVEECNGDEESLGGQPELNVLCRV